MIVIGGEDVELPRRKPNRLRGYDYSQSGVYFITICTQDRNNILCDMVGDGFPVPNLTDYGLIVEKYLNLITEKYPVCEVEKSAIMPNHIHLIIMIYNNRMGNLGTGNPSPTVGNIIGWFKYQSTKTINQKYNYAGNKIWQRSFYDHIIRNKQEYQKIWQYIDENPMKWEEDCFYNKKTGDDRRRFLRPIL